MEERSLEVEYTLYWYRSPKIYGPQSAGVRPGLIGRVTCIDKHTLTGLSRIVSNLPLHGTFVGRYVGPLTSIRYVSLVHPRD